MLSETLAEYSALMVMEKEYGPERCGTSSGTSSTGTSRAAASEVLEELPLMLVENQTLHPLPQGQLVMYALRDYIGEDG